MATARLKAFGPGPGPAYDPAIPAPRSAARVERGRIRHLSEHLARLRVGSSIQGQDLEWIESLASEVEAWVKLKSRGPVEVLRLRVLGSRVWALLEPLPATPHPYLVKALPHPLKQGHPFAPHKGLLGLWSTPALEAAHAAGAADALLFWPDGTLVETAIASIALEVEGELWLPPSEGRVASLAERLDLPEWAGPRPRRVRAFNLKDLEAGQLWCFNAVRGVWPGTLL